MCSLVAGTWQLEAVLKLLDLHFERETVQWAKSLRMCANCYGRRSNQSICQFQLGTADYEQVAKRFYEIWKFPHCIGALDGKHCRIKCPAHSGSMYFNYKKTFSIVLQGVADDHYKFLFIDVGGFGKQSDGEPLGRQILEGCWNKTNCVFPKKSVCLTAI